MPFLISAGARASAPQVGGCVAHHSLDSQKTALENVTTE
jgi:hypothetical protein